MYESDKKMTDKKKYSWNEFGLKKNIDKLFYVNWQMVTGAHI